MTVMTRRAWKYREIKDPSIDKTVSPVDLLSHYHKNTKSGAQRSEANWLLSQVRYGQLNRQLKPNPLESLH